MPLPASVPTGTVIGRWWNRDGTDSTGTILFLAQALIEVPDLPEGVVLPTRVEVPVTAGVLNKVLAAGYYKVAVNLTDNYKSFKTVQVVAGQTLNLPDAIGVVPPDSLVTPVRTVNGVAPDSSGNITISVAGGVTSVNGDTGPAVVLDAADVGAAPTVHTHSIANVTGLQDALDSKQAAGDYATNTALNTGLATKQDDVLINHDNLVESTPNPYYDVPNTSDVWTIFSAPGSWVIPAVPGDRIEAKLQVLTRGLGDWLVDLAVIVSGVPVRYLSNGTSTPSAAGFPGGYPFTQGTLEFQPVTGEGFFTAQAGDISGGNVTIQVVVKSTTTGGRFYANANFPSQVNIKNYRQ